MFVAEKPHKMINRCKCVFAFFHANKNCKIIKESANELPIDDPKSCNRCGNELEFMKMMKMPISCGTINNFYLLSSHTIRKCGNHAIFIADNIFTTFHNAECNALRHHQRLPTFYFGTLQYIQPRPTTTNSSSIFFASLAYILPLFIWHWDRLGERERQMGWVWVSGGILGRQPAHWACSPRIIFYINTLFCERLCLGWKRSQKNFLNVILWFDKKFSCALSL